MGLFNRHRHDYELTYERFTPSPGREIKTSGFWSHEELMEMVYGFTTKEWTCKVEGCGKVVQRRYPGDQRKDQTKNG